MQMLTHTFTTPVLTTLYNQYSKSIFSEAVRTLMEKGELPKEEQSIIFSAISLGKEKPELFRKSFIIYLSHGLISSKSPEERETAKKQLLLELSVSLLSEGRESSIRLPNGDPGLFSLFLNRKLPSSFDEMAGNADSYTLLKNGRPALSISRNNGSAITDDTHFLEEDHNPFNRDNDHPDTPFVAYDLGGIPKERWISQFRNAYGIIREKVPSIYDDIYPFLDAIVPHGYQKAKQLSSSYTKSPGIIYLSYTDEDTTQAEAIIHEAHHTIYNIISWKYPLLLNDDSLKYYSAYRPDARHIRGCFLGLHAFVAVQNFYRKLLESDSSTPDGKAAETFMLAFLKNGKVITVLERHAQFTREGALLFRDITSRYHEDASFFDTLTGSKPSLYEKARREAEDHFVQAKRSNAVLLH